jgi:hypothetical protein
MHTPRAGRGSMVLAFVVVGLMLVAGTGAASAAGLKLCVPSKEGKPLVTPKAGVCKTGYTLTELGAEGKQGPAGPQGAPGKEGAVGAQGATGKEGPLGAQGAPGKEGPLGPEGPIGKEGAAGPEGKNAFTAEEQATLKAILPFIKFSGSAIGGKPTIQFSGANVQILSGAGKETTLNGAGNLVVGYDESPGAQTGSNNIVVGTKQVDVSYGGVIAGQENVLEAPFSDVFGTSNTVQGLASSVLGGVDNRANGQFSAVAGGGNNETTTFVAAVAGGESNVAEGQGAAVAGGASNIAAGVDSSVAGGVENHALNHAAVITGGLLNEATGPFSTILGGHEIKLAIEFGHTP